MIGLRVPARRADHRLLLYEQLSKIVPLFVIFYGLLASFGNLYFGPGAAACWALLASESYATAVRGTCYGISAAVGKAGAAIGTEAFTPIQEQAGEAVDVTIIAAICGIAGILVTHFFIPENNGEDRGEGEGRAVQGVSERLPDLRLEWGHGRGRSRGEGE